jgi:hypothetical protein
MTDVARPVATSERRKDPSRAAGWTREEVVAKGLGALNGRDGPWYVVRVEGRKSGPVLFKLSQTDMVTWNQVRRRAHGLDQNL